MAESAAEAIDKILLCWCHEAYKDRGMTQPDCPRCNFADDIHAIFAAARAQDAERIRAAEEDRAQFAKQAQESLDASVAALERIRELEGKLRAALAVATERAEDLAALEREQEALRDIAMDVVAAWDGDSTTPVWAQVNRLRAALTSPAQPSEREEAQP